ncbi:MAG: zf-HC2 domain-containing protein [Anaerolineae bacterium]|nr:zf-HC2 domain-containing protein [Anaerolineae bacterium]
MPTEHITSALEAYLDYQLAPEERRAVETHLAVCPTCREDLRAARHLANELRPTLIAALGQPVPSPALRQRVRRAFEANSESQRRFISWAVTGKVFNAVGTLAVIALLAFGVWTVIQGQLPGAEVLPQFIPLTSSTAEITEPVEATAPTPAPTPTSTLAPIKSFDSDSLPEPVVPFDISPEEKSPETLPAPEFTQQETAAPPVPAEPAPAVMVESPAGTIAFAYYNPAPGRQVYETHLINADGSNHRLFPLDGISEPALRATNNGTFHLAYRAYSEPTSPRSLLSSDLEGRFPTRVGGFWEDAQPDWSPTEERLIYASQREVDRHWRLYTSWGDGTNEKNLRREGESPTFAPDGFHFAFVSCDNTGNRCGLWVGDLKTSEYESQPILEDPLVKSPDWSPVAEEIAYMANPGDNWDLYLVNSDGTNVRRLTDDPAIEGLPAWSPDGKWLAFLSNREGNWGIWLLHLASGETRRIFEFDGGIFTPPNRSPYGERDWYDEQISWGE